MRRHKYCRIRGYMQDTLSLVKRWLTQFLEALLS